LRKQIDLTYMHSLKFCPSAFPLMVKYCSSHKYTYMKTKVLNFNY
jgi:hypothetical protein